MERRLKAALGEVIASHIFTHTHANHRVGKPGTENLGGCGDEKECSQDGEVSAMYI